MVHTFIILKSTLLKYGCAPLKNGCAPLKSGCAPLKYGCAPLKYGCTTPICWSEHFTCLFNKSYLKLLKNIFLLVGGLGLPDFSGLGCTAKLSKHTNKQSNTKLSFEFSKLKPFSKQTRSLLKRSFFDRFGRSKIRSEWKYLVSFVVKACFSDLEQKIIFQILRHW